MHVRVCIFYTMLFLLRIGPLIVKRLRCCSYCGRAVAAEDEDVMTHVALFRIESALVRVLSRYARLRCGTSVSVSLEVLAEPS